jgi:hypothetical protein
LKESGQFFFKHSRSLDLGESPTLTELRSALALLEKVKQAELAELFLVYSEKRQVIETIIARLSEGETTNNADIDVGATSASSALFSSSPSNLQKTESIGLNQKLNVSPDTLLAQPDVIQSLINESTQTSAPSGLNTSSANVSSPPMPKLIFIPLPADVAGKQDSDFESMTLILATIV